MISKSSLGAEPSSLVRNLLLSEAEKVMKAAKEYADNFKLSGKAGTYVGSSVIDVASGALLTPGFTTVTNCLSP